MKLITRVRERTNPRSGCTPLPFGPWEVCEGTEGREPAELKTMASDKWRLEGDHLTIVGSGYGWQLFVKTPYTERQYRVVDDDFDVAKLNNR